MATPSRPWQLISEPLSREVLHGAAPLTPLQVQLLTHRGITEPDVMRHWLAADAALVTTPLAMPDIERAVSRINAAIAANERIGVIGDCDADGLTATAIIVETLNLLGVADVAQFVAPRIDDGRGLTMTAVEAMHADGVRLCITVDNGSSSVDEVAALHALGIDTIITDHHHLPEIRPAAYAIVNPMRTDAHYPHPELSGAGVALQLARALLGDADLTHPHVAPLVELAGLGILADAVPLGAENHALIRMGIRQMIAKARPGIRALFRMLGLVVENLGPRDLSFAIAPRLNAAGRLGDPYVALSLLLATNLDDAAQFAHQLDALNGERQRQTETMFAEAHAQAVEQVAQDAPILFVTYADWPMGLVGPVAGRLADEFGRLAVVVALHGDACRGSLRGPRWFHIAEALGQCTPSLPQFGGHAQAGGFSAPSAQVPLIQQQLTAAYLVAMQSDHSADLHTYQVDAVLPLERITWDYARQVRNLAPFGSHFSEPLFVSERLNLSKIRSVADRHLKFIAEQNGLRRTFFWRHGIAEFQRMKDHRLVDVIWRMPISIYPSPSPEPGVVAVCPVEE